MAYSVGAISGGHFNPAVSLAMLLNKRLSLKDFVGYVISQFIGAIVASAIVFDLVHELGLSTKNLGQTDFPNISVGGAFITETLVTFLFILVILLVTSNKWGNANFAGLVIGITLALMIIVALNLTGGSLNPARSFGPALFAGGSAMSHYWLYLVAPLVGAVLAAGVGNYMGSEE
ncbi:aquaporin [Pediococcus ethanolidurans]